MHSWWEWSKRINTSTETQRDKGSAVESLTDQKQGGKERRHVGWRLDCSRRNCSTLQPLNVHFLFVLTGTAPLWFIYNGGSNGGQPAEEMAAIVAYKFFTVSSLIFDRCLDCTGRILHYNPSFKIFLTQKYRGIIAQCTLNNKTTKYLFWMKNDPCDWFGPTGALKRAMWGSWDDWWEMKKKKFCYTSPY